jgi:hypothetical protein
VPKLGEVTHGHSRRGVKRGPEYLAWTNMKTRCFNPASEDYPRYGGRGITVCDRWLNGDGNRSGFECFLGDVGPRPFPGATIDRERVDGHYEPGNVRWLSRQGQNRNRRHHLRVSFRGEERLVIELAAEFGLNYKTVRDRLRRGWDPEKAITTPADQRRSYWKPQSADRI